MHSTNAAVFTPNCKVDLLCLASTAKASLPLRLVATQVRGVSSTVEELQHILQHSESTGLIVQDAATLDKLLPALRGSDEGLSSSSSSSSNNGSAALPIRFVVQLWGEPSAEAAAALGPALHRYGDVLARGSQQVGAGWVACQAWLCCWAGSTCSWGVWHSVFDASGCWPRNLACCLAGVCRPSATWIATTQ